MIAVLAIGSAAAALPAYASNPCCDIVAINSSAGIVTAKVYATGQQFEFRLNNPAQTQSLRVGQPLYANLQNRQVSLDGQHPAGQIVSIAATAPTVSIRPLPRIVGWTKYGTIASASGQAIQAQPAPTAAAIAPTGIQFAQPPSQQGFLVGQSVWVRPQLHQAFVVTYPIQAHQKTDTGHSHYVESWITVSNTGRIDGKTHVWSNEALRGFEGGVSVFLLDDSGNFLFPAPGQTDKHCYGVNGTSMPGAPSSRTETWSVAVDTSVIAQTRSISIVQVDCPTDHWNDMMKKAKDVEQLAQGAAQIYSDLSGGGGSGSSGGNGGGTPTGGTGGTDTGGVSGNGAVSSTQGSAPRTAPRLAKPGAFRP